MNTHEATRLLIERLGTEQVLTDEASLYEASMDNLRYSRLPSARIIPVIEDAVSDVLEDPDTATAARVYCAI